MDEFDDSFETDGSINGTVSVEIFFDVRGFEAADLLELRDLVAFFIKTSIRSNSNLAIAKEGTDWSYFLVERPGSRESRSPLFRLRSLEGFSGWSGPVRT